MHRNKAAWCKEQARQTRVRIPVPPHGTSGPRHRGALSLHLSHGSAAIALRTVNAPPPRAWVGEHSEAFTPRAVPRAFRSRWSEASGYFRWQTDYRASAHILSCSSLPVSGPRDNSCPAYLLSIKLIHQWWDTANVHSLTSHWNVPLMAIISPVPQDVQQHEWYIGDYSRQAVEEALMKDNKVMTSVGPVYWCFPARRSGDTQACVLLHLGDCSAGRL